MLSRRNHSTNGFLVFFKGLVNEVLFAKLACLACPTSAPSGHRRLADAAYSYCSYRSRSSYKYEYDQGTSAPRIQYLLYAPLTSIAPLVLVPVRVQWYILDSFRKPQNPDDDDVDMG